MATENDLYEELAHGDARDFFKKASVRENAREAFDWAKNTARAHKTELIGAGVGAAVGAGVTYAGSKRWGGKPSMVELDAAELRAGHMSDEEKLKRLGKKPGFAHEMGGAVSKGYEEMARAMSNHPTTAAAVFGGSAAGTGARLAKLLEKMKDY